jgi:branched-chain amino acid aminotransferase
MELARGLGVEVVEKRLLPYDFATADEVFFTSTPYCIMPCTKFNGQAVGSGVVGPLVGRLLGAWSELVGVDIVAQATEQLAVAAA